MVQSILNEPDVFKVINVLYAADGDFFKSLGKEQLNALQEYSLKMLPLAGKGQPAEQLNTVIEQLKFFEEKNFTTT